tara:strand:+ start:14796 stop:15902 length:1107 start_codon:yes stop_codon:yes gene_type:complete
LKSQYKFYGWHLSYFAGKLRGYMNYKQLNFVEKACGYYDLTHKFPKKVGSSSMPVVETCDGEWLSDTTEIIAELEKRHPERSIVITTPKQKIVAMLLEAWFDDMWVTPAMYTRWMYPESYNLFKQEGGQALLPFLPSFVRNIVVEKTAMAKLRAYLPSMGINPKQNELIDAWTREQLALLDKHFSQYDYLLGGKPSIADYGLLGPMYGHLNRDPWPKREMIDKLPNLQRWTERTHKGTAASGPLLSGDNIPETLMPILKAIVGEFLPMVNKIVAETEKTVKSRANKSGDNLPRIFKGVSFPMGTAEFSRNVFSYTLWMMQRIQNVYIKLNDTEQKSVDELFTELGADGFMQCSLGPKLKRHGLGVKLA